MTVAPNWVTGIARSRHETRTPTDEDRRRADTRRRLERRQEDRDLREAIGDWWDELPPEPDDFDEIKRRALHALARMETAGRRRSTGSQS